MAQKSREQAKASELFKSIMKEFRKKDFSGSFSIFHISDEVCEKIPASQVMTLETVENNLNQGLYDDKYWFFVRDVNMALRILIKQYTTKSKTHNVALELREMFQNKMDSFMKSTGQCCGYWYINEAKKVPCSAESKENECMVEDGQAFYRYDDFTFCDEHFRTKFHDQEEIKLNDEIIVPRSKMIRFIYRNEVVENMVRCVMCRKIFHERCVVLLGNTMVQFHCKNCRRPCDFRFDNLRAEYIPTTPADEFITKFVTKNIESFHAPVTIRMLSSMKKSFATNYKFHHNGLPKKIEYTNCTTFAFLKDAEGFDICFFTIFAQLYDLGAPKSNRRAVYLSYIDSVKVYLGDNRTELYQLIVLGLIAYLKSMGFERVFIWSCPPNEGVDYVFPYKPKEQKVPDKKVLNEWYVNMIQCGKRLNVIKESEGPESFAFFNNWKDIGNVPLFPDDLWVITLAGVIAQTEMENHKAETTFRLNGVAIYFDKKECMWDLFQTKIKELDNSYFILKLKSRANEKSRTEFNLEKIERNWICNRHILVDFFCDAKLMFNSVRQARFATYILLYRIFMESCICRHCLKYSKLHSNLLCEECTMVASKLQHMKIKKRSNEDLIFPTSSQKKQK